MNITSSRLVQELAPNVGRQDGSTLLPATPNEFRTPAGRCAWASSA